MTAETADHLADGPAAGRARLRFHWSMSAVGDSMRGERARAAVSGVPDMQAHLDFCRLAEECGIESLLTAFGFHRADPIALAAALGVQTERIKFLVAVRSGVSAPTYFAQQVNSLSTLIGGRVAINIVAGHSPHEHRYYGDFLEHDERYARTDEFFSICNGLWRGDGPVDFAGSYYTVEGARLTTPFLAPDRSTPEIYAGGNSELAEQLAIRHASCQLRLPDTPEAMAPGARRVREHGVDVGIACGVISRNTHDEAVEAAYAMAEARDQSARQVHEDFRRRSDSVAFTSTLTMAKDQPSWRAPYLWTGLVPYLGAPSIALVGSPDEITDALFEYRRVGVTQFLMLGWPDAEEMQHFATEIIPRVRRREAAAVDA